MSQAPMLITTVHDPERRMLQRIEAHCGSLSRYAGVFASVTETTDEVVVSALRSVISHVDIVPSGAPGEGQRRALRAAFDRGAESFLYCDFDRWLHWLSTYPDELMGLPDAIVTEAKEVWYVCLGRTERAFLTHPIAQRLPEEATNRALSSALGRTLDATAGAAWMSREGARLILDDSTAMSKATDLEWPALVAAVDSNRVGGLFCEGLEFETAAYYRDQIVEAGSLERWIGQTYDRPEVFQQRLQLAVDSIESMRSVLSGRQPDD